MERTALSADVGSLLHDLNNLLSVIANYSRFLDESLDARTEMDAFDPTAWKHDVAMIKEASVRAIEVARELTEMVLAQGRAPE